MKRNHSLQQILSCFLWLILAGGGMLPCRPVQAQISDNLQMGGYLQVMPVWIGADLPRPIDRDSFLEYRLQNRLNLRWFVSSEWTLNGQMRTRFFAGDLVEEIPFYARTIDRDDGLVDLSWMVAEQDHWFLHLIPDRLYTEWANSDWSVRIGRQRINWGINMVTNPNDIFNIYSFYDFDYPERPGTDAIRIQHFTGAFSRWEMAVSPSRRSGRSTAALMYAFNRSGYDFQLLGGYYRETIAAGGGWAGNIGQTGFKGEIMGFIGLQERNGNEAAPGLPDLGEAPLNEIGEINATTNGGNNLVIAVSADHMFVNSLFLVVEGVYNQSGGREQFLLTGETLSADNPTFSRFQFTAQGSYPFSPIVNGSLAAIWYPDERSLFFSPSLTWSLLQDLDLNLIGQLFAGSEDSAFSGAGHVVAASLRWSF